VGLAPTCSIILGEYRTLWGECEAEQWLEMLLSLSKIKIDVANFMEGKQRVATAVFSQRHHKKMVLHRFVLF